MQLTVRFNVLLVPIAVLEPAALEVFHEDEEAFLVFAGQYEFKVTAVVSNLDKTQNFLGKPLLPLLTQRYVPHPP